MKKLIGVIFAVDLLGGCQTTNTIGANWTPNTRAASNISFTGDDSFIQSRDWKRRDQGTQERLKFAAGEIFYEELYGIRTGWQSTDEKAYLQRFFDSLNKQGNYVPGEAQRRPVNKASMLYMTAQSPSQKCLLGVAASDQGGRTWHINLIACRSLTNRASATFESDIFDMLARMQVDGGALNKAKAAP